MLCSTDLQLDLCGALISKEIINGKNKKNVKYLCLYLSSS